MSLADPGHPVLDRSTTDPDWWRGAVVYQIYPRSFQDGGGDGIGDLPGIVGRLGHIASLGVDAIWLSPFFKSPMKDFGYDVSDYRDVDPMFGTVQDFDAVVARAHELGLKVLIDLVLSHTADVHPWFVESRTSRDNAKADWYVWADAKPDGTPPNNWLSIFGGSAWEWDSARMQYYLHNFLVEQPDLNFHNPDVQEELLAVARFWLDRGVDGFRLDTVNFYVHDAQLRDNPALPEDQRNADTAPAVNPYNFQDHLYDKTQPENLDFLRRFRAVCDAYEAITTVGEVGEGQRGPEVQSDYTQPGLLHMCYGFDFLSAARPTADRTAAILRKFEATIRDGWACWAMSNHDVARWPSRWQLPPEALPVHLALLLSLRGSVCLYQGEELGLNEAYVAFEDLQDPYGKRFWPKFMGRDGCRTPMPWSADRHGGFTDGTPWLPVAMEHLELSVAHQAHDDASTLALYRRLIAFRQGQPALVKGTQEIVRAEGGVLTLRRTHGDSVLCTFNLTDAAVPFTPEGTRLDTPFPAPEGQLGPWQAHFAKG